MQRKICPGAEITTSIRKESSETGFRQTFMIFYTSFLGFRIPWPQKLYDVVYQKAKNKSTKIKSAAK